MGPPRRRRAVDLDAVVEEICNACVLEVSGIEHLAAYGPWDVKDVAVARTRASLCSPRASLVTTEISNGKSLLDTKLVLDVAVYDAVATTSTYVIVSADVDMVPLVRRLKERGRTVICAGRDAQTGRLLPYVCDKFVYLAPRSAQKPKTRPTPPSTESGPKADLRRWFEEIMAGYEELPASVVSTSLKEKIRTQTGMDPDAHLLEVTGTQRFKSRIEWLFPGDEYRVSDSGGRVERTPPEEIGETMPPFRGAPRPTVVVADETEADEPPPWEPERMMLLDLPVLD